MRTEDFDPCEGPLEALREILHSLVAKYWTAHPQ